MDVTLDDDPGPRRRRDADRQKFSTEPNVSAGYGNLSRTTTVSLKGQLLDRER